MFVIMTLTVKVVCVKLFSVFSEFHAAARRGGDQPADAYNLKLIPCEKGQT